MRIDPFIMRALTLNASLALSLRSAHRLFPMVKSIASNANITIPGFSFDLYRERLDQAALVVSKSPPKRSELIFGDNYPLKLVRQLRDASRLNPTKQDSYTPLIYAASSIASVMESVHILLSNSVSAADTRKAKRLAGVSLRKSTHCALLADTNGVGNWLSTWFFDCLKIDNQRLIELGHKRRSETFDRGEPINLSVRGPLKHAYVKEMYHRQMKRAEVKEWFAFSNACPVIRKKELGAVEEYATALLAFRVGQTPIQYRLQRIMNGVAEHGAAVTALGMCGGFLASQTENVSPAIGFAAAGSLALAITTLCLFLENGATDYARMQEFR